MSELVIQKDWILITYDIPKSQDSIRKKTIRTLRKMGALRHTDSVYYLPFNAQAYELAANLPGETYVWRSTPTSDSQANQLTKDFYNKIMAGVMLLDKRLDDLECASSSLTLEAKKQRLQYSVELWNHLRVAANNIGLLVHDGLADVRQRLERLREQVR